MKNNYLSKSMLVCFTILLFVTCKNTTNKVVKEEEEVTPKKQRPSAL